MHPQPVPLFLLAQVLQVQVPGDLQVLLVLLFLLVQLPLHLLHLLAHLQVQLPLPLLVQLLLDRLQLLVMLLVLLIAWLILLPLPLGLIFPGPKECSLVRFLFYRIQGFPLLPLLPHCARVGGDGKGGGKEGPSRGVIGL